ncbi:MAG: hypothetical protein KA436_09545 [Oligoflexales bacterium]|nr:hypothetical protein [Oligoflexales bacterium]
MRLVMIIISLALLNLGQNSYGGSPTGQGHQSRHLKPTVLQRISKLQESKHRLRELGGQYEVLNAELKQLYLTIEDMPKPADHILHTRKSIFDDMTRLKELIDNGWKIYRQNMAVLPGLLEELQVAELHRVRMPAEQDPSKFCRHSSAVRELDSRLMVSSDYIQQNIPMLTPSWLLEVQLQLVNAQTLYQVLLRNVDYILQATPPPASRTAAAPPLPRIAVIPPLTLMRAAALGERKLAKSDPALADLTDRGTRARALRALIEAGRATRDRCDVSPVRED